MTRMTRTLLPVTDKDRPYSRPNYGDRKYLERCVSLGGEFLLNLEGAGAPAGELRRVGEAFSRVVDVCFPGGSDVALQEYAWPERVLLDAGTRSPSFLRIGTLGDRAYFLAHAFARFAAYDEDHGQSPRGQVFTLYVRSLEALGRFCVRLPDRPGERDRGGTSAASGGSVGDAVPGASPVRG